MDLTAVEAIAAAVLYEGYALYPYRPSSVKNQRRFNFGLVEPRTADGADTGTSSMQTECVVLGDAQTTIDVKVRCLQLARREERSWLEAEERTLILPSLNLAELATLSAPTCRPLHCPARVEVSVVSLSSSAFRLRVRIDNDTRLDEAQRASHDELLLASLVSTHTLLGCDGGVFISLLDPPDEWRAAVAACQNERTWPVMAGDAQARNTMLSSPIILYDYPQIAAESPGDLFDGTEIDEILALRILTLTDAEKEEMRHADERTRRVLERTEAMTAEQFMKLHGIVRTLGT